MDYIAFIAGLPEIARDDRKLPLAMEEFREQLAYYLKGKDRALLDLFFLPNDHVQVLRLLRKQEAAEGLRTVYPLAVLEAAVANPEADRQLPGYLREFIAVYKEERLRPHDAFAQPDGAGVCGVRDERAESGGGAECPEIRAGGGARGCRRQCFRAGAADVERQGLRAGAGL